MNLTLCLIVKNEARNIAHCLRVFKDLYTESVIIDTGSSDTTKKIAKKMGATIYDFPWNDNFSEARNFALSKARTEWIMMIDADESMKKRDVEILRKKLEIVKKNTKIILLPHVQSDDKNNTYKAYKATIWKKELNLEYKLAVHEYLDITKEKKGSTLRLEYDIIHTTPHEVFQKNFKKKIEILEKETKQGEKEPRYFFFLAQDNQQIGNYKKALEWYRKYIRFEKEKPDVQHRACVQAGICCQCLGDIPEAEKWYKKAIKIQPNFIEPYLLLGDISKQEKQSKKAIEWYLRAMQCKLPETNIYVNEKLYQGYAEKKIVTMLNITKRA